MKLSLLMHWVKAFNLLSACLLEIDQAQLKNSNYHVLLSVLSVYMEICPKEVFISIWHLRVQIKVHKENMRTKCETLEAYSEPCQTSKIKLFAKILNGFQLLTTVFFKNYYIQRCIQIPDKHLRCSFLRK